MKHGKTLVSMAVLAFVWPLVSGASADDNVHFVPGDAPAMATHQPEPAGGWLGVQLAPVPAALASQLRLDKTGVMIRNIFKDSPADQAKLERYDVIVAVDDQAVDRGMEGFSRLVQSRKPGDQFKLTLYRGGQKTDATVTLAAAPERLDENALKYKDDPDVTARRMFGLRGKILRPGPEGWILDDLGELPDVPGMEQWFEREEAAPGPSEDIEEARRVDAQGNAIQVRKNVDGSIEVRRYKSGTPIDKVEPKVYDNMEQLRKDDPEAAGLLQAPASRPAGPQGGHVFRWRQDKGREEDLRKHQESMRQYQDALRDYMKRFQDRGPGAPPPPPAVPQPPNGPKWREWRDRVMPGMPSAPPAPLPGPAGPRQPEARFELHPDGSITANVDDGPTQLNLTFPDEKTFQQKAPKLYERYRHSMDETR